MERRALPSPQRAFVAAMMCVSTAVMSTQAQGPVQNAARVTRVPQPITMYGTPTADDLSTVNADVVFLGVPYDLGHSSVPGTRLGPAAIRQASEIAGPRNARGYYDRETGEAFLKGIRLVDAGDVVIPSANVTESLANVTSAVAAIVARGAMPVTIGGDHSITFAVLRGYEAAGKKIHVIHLDSHQDFGPEAGRIGGQPAVNHGNHLRYAMDLPWISGITMLGLRGLAHGGGATASEVASHNIVKLSASRVLQMGPVAAAARIPSADAYYVTIDIDVVDPAIAPATGTPVPGGFSYYQICELLDAIASKGHIVGFDIMEVSPPYDHNNETSLLAAYVGMRFLGSVFQHQQPVPRNAAAPKPW